MMTNLIKLAQKLNITILNNIAISKINSLTDSAELLSDYGTFYASKVVVATNGFAKELLNIADVKPARAQVLITKPIKNLKIKGTFHYDEGFYYFRNIDNRILFGGGRNLDLKGETTTDLELNTKIQKHLDYLLKNIILLILFILLSSFSTLLWGGVLGDKWSRIPI